MLLSATQPDKLRVVVVDDRTLVDVVLDAPRPHQCKSNIYNGVITRVEPLLQTCFVDYGGVRDGLLPFDAIAPGGLRDAATSRAGSSGDGPRAGQEIMVQAVAEDDGDGARLTSFVSLPGRYLDLFAQDAHDGASGPSGAHHDPALRDVVGKLHAPPGTTLVPRHDAFGLAARQLEWDAHFLARMWRAIDAARKNLHGASMIHQDAAPVIRAIRDHCHFDMDEILVDSGEIHEQLYQFMGHVFPEMQKRVKHYRGSEPLFSRFRVQQPFGLPASAFVPLSSSNAWPEADPRTPGFGTRGSARPGPGAPGWFRRLVAKLRCT